MALRTQPSLSRDAGNTAAPRLSKSAQQNLWGLFFCAPWILHFLLLIILPMLASFVFSLFDFSGIIGTGSFVWFDNYKELVTLDDRFRQSVTNTVVIGLMTVVPGLLMAIGLGALLTGRLPGKSLFRLVIYGPSVIPPVVIAIVWGQMLNPQIGVVNYLLELVGIQGPAWLGHPTGARWALAVISWYGIGGSVLAFAAAFEEIPKELVEASKIDGAGPIRRFWAVELPMVSPQVFFFVVNGILAMLVYFVAPFAVTQGGPADATLVWSLYMYRLMFAYNKFGHGAAAAWIMAMVVVLLLIIVFRTARRWVHYEGGADR